MELPNFKRETAHEREQIYQSIRDAPKLDTIIRAGYEMYQLHIQAGTPIENPTIDEVFKAGFEFFRVMRREELEREQKLEHKLQEEQKSRGYRYDNSRYHIIQEDD
ncbi:TPA: hypothetical protein HA251_02905 [Candidatus Woesearchaeota archaeon]|nr:hypothetical protein [Candidatus Woesearchaeota archaeon]